MPRYRTGCALERKIKKGKKTLKVWYARIEYTDDSGIKRRIEKKPAYNSPDDTGNKELLRDRFMILAENVFRNKRFVVMVFVMRIVCRVM